MDDRPLEMSEGQALWIGGPRLYEVQVEGVDNPNPLTWQALVDYLGSELARRLPNVQRAKSEIFPAGYRQHNVACVLNGTLLKECSPEYLEKRFFQKIIGSMAETVEREGYKVLGEMHLPDGGCEAAHNSQSGLPVRVIAFYEPSTDQRMCRFDIIGKP